MPKGARLAGWTLRVALCAIVIPSAIQAVHAADRTVSDAAVEATAEAAGESALDATGEAPAGAAPQAIGQWLTGQPKSRMAGSDERWTANARHAYSKIQPWNCDQSLAVLINRGGRQEATFIDEQGEVAFQRAVPGSEARWLPGDSQRMFVVDDDTVSLWQVIDDSTRALLRFEDLTALRIGPWEGNLSQDGSRVVLSGEQRSDGRLVSVLLDVSDGRELARYRHPSGQVPDWISVSASGRYIVMNGALVGDGQDQTRVFNDAFDELGEPWTDYGRPSHYDLALDEQGDDVAIGVSKSQPDDGLVIKRRLSDGKVTALTDAGYASHTSTRNTRLPGWAFVTYQGKLPDHPPYANEIVAVRTDGSGGVHRISRFPDAGDDYWAQPQAVPSWDGSRVLWAQVRALRAPGRKGQGRRSTAAGESPAIGTVWADSALPKPIGKGRGTHGTGSAATVQCRGVQ